MQLFHLMPLFHQHALQDWGSGLMRLHHPHALQGWAAGARARLLRRIGIRLKDAPEVYVKKVCLADSLREHPISLIYRGNPCKKISNTHGGVGLVRKEARATTA